MFVYFGRNVYFISYNIIHSFFQIKLNTFLENNNNKKIQSLFLAKTNTNQNRLSVTEKKTKIAS